MDSISKRVRIRIELKQDQLIFMEATGGLFKEVILAKNLIYSGRKIIQSEIIIKLLKI